MSVVLQRREWFRQDTSVENIFINEYMTSAPGDYVKVYIYALMNAQLGQDADDDRIANDLDTDRETVDRAWDYWENAGAVERIGDSVRILNLKDGAADGNRKKPPLGDEEFRTLLTSIENICGKTLHGTEVQAVSGWMKDLKAEADIILYAYTYCAERDKTDYRYVGKVLSDWMKKGYSTPEEVAEHLGKKRERMNLYRDILRRLGLDRKWTPKEEEIMDTWLDDWGFSMERIIDACDETRKIRNPNINYVDKVLSNWRETAGGSETAGRRISVAHIMEYYEEIRRQSEKEAEERKQEAYERIPGIKNVEAEIEAVNRSLVKAITDRDEEKRADLSGRREQLYMDKAVMLTENDLPPDYMDIRYRCPKCRDTGADDDGNRCSCFEERAQEAVQWMKKRKRAKTEY